MFAGTVVGVKNEKGSQTLDIQYPQGRIRFQAEGDFQVGDKVRLSFPGNGSVRVEKGQTNAEGAADWQGAGYTLPRNLDALKDLRAFEEQVVRWMGARPQGGNPAAADKGAFARLSLPQMLMQAMDRKGGKEFLAQSLASLDPALVSALFDSLDEAEGEPGPKAALADLLRSLARPPDQSTAAARSHPEAGAFLGAEAGEGHAPWFGRIAERRNADGILFAASRMGYAGAGNPGRSGAEYRYVLDVGGSTLEAFSPEAREPGEFADFALERQGGRLQARFLDPAQSLPAEARAALPSAAPEVRQGMLLASRYLGDFRSEPYYGKLVKDFGTVLAQSGLLQAPAAGQPAAIPKQDQLDGLLKLFVSYPRDAQDPAGQAKAWGDAVRDPEALLKLLKDMKPDRDASLLRPETFLRLPGAPARAPGASGTQGPGAGMDLPAALQAALKASGESPEAAAGFLRKFLPDAFQSGDLLRLAKEAAVPGSKEHEAARFLLQAVSSSLPHDAPVPEGAPTQFYYYQGQEWRNLQVTWRRDGGGKDGRGRSGPKAPLQVNVETQSRHMGRVSVGVAWEPKGARLDFRNQFLDVRDLLSRSLPELEKSLALLDFKVSSWTYEILSDDAQALPSPGTVRPSGLLDLKG